VPQSNLGASADRRVEAARWDIFITPQTAPGLRKVLGGTRTHRHLWPIRTTPSDGTTFYDRSLEWPQFRMKRSQARTPDANMEVPMLEIQDEVRSTIRTCDCSICGHSVRVNPLKATDTDVICKECRCRRCSIPMSVKPCHRCGVAHGTPSAEPGLCELCFESSTGDASVDATSPSSSWAALA
jgi:hypothetical protein